MQKNIFVSFVIPIYNVNRYLDDLFTSFTHLDKSNYELICIDDKGDENPGEILKKWGEKLPIKVVENSKNLGISVSRNNGLKHLSKKTTHVIFVDSDDAISDINPFDEIHIGKITYFNEYSWTTKGLKYVNLNKHFGTNHFHGSIPGKAFPIEIIKEFKHDETVKTYEDILISRRITKKYKDSIILSDSPLIKYRQRASSITNSGLTPEEFNDMSNQWMKLVDENLIGNVFAHYELRQRYWIWRKYLKGKVELNPTKLWIKIAAFLGGNSVRFLGLKKIVYRKESKNLFE